MVNLYWYFFFNTYTYASQIWGQLKSKHFTRLVSLQKKTIKIMNFTNFRDPVTPLYKAMKILKLSDNIRVNNFFFFLDNIKDNSTPALKKIIPTCCFFA